MCGIAGFVYKNNSVSAEFNKIKAMTDSIVHRGPDDEGQYTNANLALGHRRLSILDLSENGKQPMFSYDSRYVIVFNGEIYNYIELKNELQKNGIQFKNGTDTEVIIEAYRCWGTECVKRFNGMWAFGLYDTQENILFFSRDRFGVKPLYILNNDDVLAFGSEIKAIIAAFPEENIPNYDMIYRYLSGSAREDCDEMTFYKNIISFQRSGCMIYDINTGKSKVWKYWELNIEEFYNKWIKRKNPEKTFLELFENAVEIRLRADVEVGACLSGGLDSSAIVGVCSKKLKRKLHTFSSIYEDKDCNEKKYIDEVNKFADTIPYYIYPDNATDNLLESLKKIIYHHGGPNSSGSLYSQYSVFKGIHGKVKVVIDGQGSDELFGGYLHFYPYRISDMIKEKKSSISIIKALSIITEEWPEMIKMLNDEEIIDVLGEKFYRYIINYNKKANIPSSSVWKNGNYPLLTKEFLSKVDTSYTSEMDIYETDSKLNSFLCDQTLKTSIPVLLHNEDGNSMAFSIESRMPFLDYRIVEFAFALDGKYKMRNEWTKWIVRKACKKYLPKIVYKRRNKMGFPAPFARWLRECPENDEMKEIIFSFGERNIVPLKTIEYYYNKHMQNEGDYNRLLYSILCCELWLRTCNIKKNVRNTPDVFVLYPTLHQKRNLLQMPNLPHILPRKTPLLFRRHHINHLTANRTSFS